MKTSLLSAVIGATILPLLAWGADSCALAAPPKDAGVGSDDGALFYVYPRTLAAGYSGCQTMWDESGRRTAQLTFDKGGLSQYELTDYAKPTEPKTRRCTYAGGKASGDDCPAYDEASHGLAAAPVGEEPAIPAGKDARK